MPDVTVYRSGLCMCSVCAAGTVTGEEVAAAVNERDTETMRKMGHELLLQWHVSKNETFKGGEPNPCECNDDPTRKHWLLEC